MFRFSWGCQLITCLFFVVTALFSGKLEAVSFTIYGAYEESYAGKLLQAALESSLQTDVQLTPIKGNVPKPRAFQLMQNENAIDIIVAGATPERVAMTQAIHFPVFKGLYGLRVNLVHRDTPDILQQVTDLEALRQLTVGQFHTWSDTQILQYNQLTIANGSDVDGLYKMLHRKRYDIFPRSILEIHRDLEQYNDLDLFIDPHSLIRYPKVHYFFVKKGNTELAQQIEAGLEVLLRNGKLDAMFNDYYGVFLDSLKIRSRNVIELENPNLPAGVPLQRKSLWVELPLAKNEASRSD